MDSSPAAVAATKVCLRFTNEQGTVFGLLTLPSEPQPCYRCHDDYYRPSPRSDAFLLSSSGKDWWVVSNFLVSSIYPEYNWNGWNRTKKNTVITNLMKYAIGTGALTAWVTWFSYKWCRPHHTTKIAFSALALMGFIFVREYWSLAATGPPDVLLASSNARYSGPRMSLRLTSSQWGPIFQFRDYGWRILQLTRMLCSSRKTPFIWGFDLEITLDSGSTRAQC